MTQTKTGATCGRTIQLLNDAIFCQSHGTYNNTVKPCNCMNGFTGRRCETNINVGGECDGCFSGNSQDPCPASCKLSMAAMLDITKTLSL